MEGEQLPKATMIAFLKKNLNISFSNEFTNKIVAIAKDYVFKLTQEANDVCTKNDKKTINAEHIEQALRNFGLECQLKQLKQIGSQIKQHNQIKQQFRQRIQQNVEKNLHFVEGDELKRITPLNRNIGVIEIKNSDESDDFDYEAEINDLQHEKEEEQ